jgi:hypothetical protein
MRILLAGILTLVALGIVANSITRAHNVLTDATDCGWHY